MPTTIDGWEAVPEFIQGQIMSAEAHLNTLARDVNALRDIVIGAQNTFVGWYAHPWGFEDEYRGYLRHRYGYLQYQIIVTGGTGILTLGTWTVTGCGALGPGSYAGTVAIPEAGFTFGNFYELVLTGCTGVVWLLREIIDTSPLAALATGPWTNAQVPTAAQWQGLAERTTAVAARLGVPKALITSYLLPDRSPQTAYGENYPCTITHQVQNLHYRIFVKAPYWCTEHDDNPSKWDPVQVCGVDVNGAGWCDFLDPCSGQHGLVCPPCRGAKYAYAAILINGRVALTLGCGNRGELEALGLTNLRYGADQGYEFEGDLDIDALGVPVGSDYSFLINYTSSTAWDGGIRLAVRYIVEQPALGAGLTGWHDLALWDYGAYVHAAPPPLNVGDFATDLNLLLLAAGQGANYPVRQNWFGGAEYFGYGDDLWRGLASGDGVENHRLWSVRQHRYLHYYVPAAQKHDYKCVDEHQQPYEWCTDLGGGDFLVPDIENEQEPVLRYRITGQNRDSEVTLPLSRGVWRVYDLSKAEGLYTGMLYWLDRVEYAIEDSEV